MPLSGLGRSKGRIRSQRRPSRDQQDVIAPCLLRQTICIAPPGWQRMLGWIEPRVRDARSDSFCHAPPWVRSRWQCQNSASVLDGQSSAPSGSSTGLFLIGPSMPRGRRAGSDQLRPPSCERISMPHQRRGLGPTL